MERIKSGKAKYDFIEVMACPSGCAGGGGQPFRDNEERGVSRGGKLYELDAASRDKVFARQPVLN